MPNQNPTPFPDLNALLDELVSGAQGILGADFTGAYLQGSLAGPHPDAYGDVDFIIVVAQPVPEAAIPALQALHARLYDQPGHWTKRLEGSYFPQEVLRRYDPAAEPLLYIDNNSRQLIRHKHDDTLVVRWVLRDHGLTLAGPDLKTLIDPVLEADLKREVRQVMRDWAAEIFADPEETNNGWYQTYAVISYCRMLQTLQTGRVESKRAAVEWAAGARAAGGQAVGEQTVGGQAAGTQAAGALDGRWAGLIQRAWAARPDQYARVNQLADAADLQSMFDFVRYALAREEV